MCRVAGAALFSLSRGVLQPYRIADPPDPDDDLGLPDGSFLWVESLIKMLVRANGTWRTFGT